MYYTNTQGHKYSIHTAAIKCHSVFRVQIKELSFMKVVFRK